MTKVNIQPFAVGRWCRTGVTVLVVNPWCLSLDLQEHFLVPLNLSAICTDANRSQGMVTIRLRHRRRQVDHSFPNDRRRPAFAGDRRLPGDVLVGAPFGRELGTGVMAIAGRPAELRPVGGEGG